MSKSGYYEARDNQLITGLSYTARKRVYDKFAAHFADAGSILDVGVTSERTAPEANFLERLHPHKERITAAGIEDASFLQSEYPGVKFVRIEPNRPLPFADASFDVVFSHAVVEHVVDPAQRRFFVAELLRVGKAAFITTPNKFFPIEPHTRMPLLHFLWPRLFYWLCDRRVVSRFYSSANLKLLSMREFRELFDLPGWAVEADRVRLGGITSNLILTVKRRAD